MKVILELLQKRNEGVVVLAQSEVLGKTGELATDEGLLSWIQTETNLTGKFCRSAEMRTLDASGLGISLEIPGWSRSDYLMIPASAYDANRFRVGCENYAPMYDKAYPEEIDPVVTPVPRFGLDTAHSEMHFLSGSGSTPAICVWLKESKKAIFLMGPAFVDGLETGLHAFENFGEGTEGSLQIRLDLPGLRPNRYRMCDANAESPDGGRNVAPGEEISLSVEIFESACSSMIEFYELFAQIRNEVVPRGTIREIMPFSKSAELIRDQRDREWWSEGELSYFDVLSEKESMMQPGWVGAGMFTLPLLSEGSEVHRRRARRTIDYIIKYGLCESGLFHGFITNRENRGDGFDELHAKDWHLLRKSGDMSLFLVRQCQALIAKEQPVPIEWTNAVRANLEAFSRMWNRDRTFGQFVDIFSTEITVGGATASGTVIAALAEGGRLLGEAKYTTVAQSAARMVGEQVASAGYSCGGPGEILKAPDSESCFGLIEGLVSVWEVTSQTEFLSLARAIAYQGITWTVSYDYPFPAKTTFGMLEMQTTGTVIASVQNKHSAPGICTLSSLAILKIARATNDEVLFSLALDIARTLPQYVSSPERPIPTCHKTLAPSGYVNERVNMSDWELGGIGHGEIFEGQCWSSVSVLLTEFEVPGILLGPGADNVWVSDHVRVLRSVRTGDGLNSVWELEIENPTEYAATVKIAVDRDRKMAWNEVWSRRTSLLIEAGSRKVITVPVTQ